jgi:glycosidase
MKGLIFMTGKKTKIISVFLAVLMVAGVFSGLFISSNAVSSQTETPDETSPNPYGLLDNADGGLILHCWCWNFNTIKENMETIAEAGYSAIQTSPINEVVVGESGGLKIYGDDADGKWYYHYQPTDQKIGNYQLGTEEEFKAMCETAHSYGVKVIVDVVANHTAANKRLVSNRLKNIEGGLYHDYVGSRTNVTRKSLTQWYSGLPDVNTQNKNYQNLILDYLKQCVADGADGFRYDTARHIELPDDDPDFASDFWPTVLENGSSYQYGEVLQGYSSAEINATRFADYSKIMDVTASTYGAKLRTYLMKFDASAKYLSDYSSEGVTPDKLVTWVESHDTYANGGQEFDAGTSFWVNNNQIRKGWALIAARDTTSLFFSRPDGSSTENIWGNNLIGPRGDDNFINPEVVAVNHFHNSMFGEETTMSNVGGKKYVMITRGTKGAVIVNSDVNKDITLNAKTTLIDGTYTDTAHNSKFVVKDGVLTGVVKADEVCVIDNLDNSHYTSEIIEPTTEEPTTEEPTTEEPTTEEPATEEPTEPVVTTPDSTVEPTEPASEATQDVTASETQPVAVKTYKYIPSAEDIASGKNFKITVEDANGEMHTYDLAPTGETVDGQPVYAAETPESIAASKIKYQIFDGETFVSQVTKEASEVADGSPVKYDGTIAGQDTTEPETEAPTVEPTDAPTDAPTVAPTTTAPKSTTAKKANTVKVKVKKAVKVKAKKLKKKAVSLKISKFLKITGAKGKVTFAKVKKGTAKKILKKIKINKNNGKITLKKGKYAKKTYKIKLKITAKGNDAYNSKTVTKTIKIKVK